MKTTYTCLDKQIYKDKEFYLVPIRNEDRYKIMQWRNEQMFHLRQVTQMVQDIRAAEKSIGNVTYELTEKQKAGKAFSRSLYVVQDLKKGEKFTEINIRSIRPGFGLHPKYLKDLIGKQAKIDFRKGDRLTKNDLK